MPGTCYLGEAFGARILRVGDDGTGPLAQVDDTTNDGRGFQLDVTTWDLCPAGEVGDVLFRSIDVAFACTNGYALGVTPIVDGTPLPEQTFSGAGTGERTAQAYLAVRGTRIAARVRTLRRLGDFELHNVGTSHVILRTTP